MKTNQDQHKTAAAAPEAPQDEFEYFRMMAKKYLPLPELDEEEYRRRWDDNDHPATEPKLPPQEEAEYFRRIREFTERRKEAGLKIDPKTAETYMDMGECFDPYGIHPLLPREAKDCPMKNWFVRSRGSDIWVWDGDLPQATRDALRNKHNPTLASQQAGVTAEDDEVPY